MSNKDWRVPPEELVRFGGALHSGAEIAEHLEYLDDAERERSEGHWPADTWTVVGTPCPNCGAYVLSNPCRLCGGEMEQAA